MGVNADDINNADNDTMTILAKYYLLLGIGTVVTALSSILIMIADVIHVLRSSQQFWVDDNSAVDQSVYFAYAIDIIINIYLIYLNIEPGEPLYRLFCVGSKCEKCIKWSTLDSAGVVLIPQANPNVHNQN